MSKRVRPKFKVGEQVKTRDEHGDWLFGKVLSIDKADPIFITVGLEHHVHRDNFRKIGPRKARKKP